MKIITQPITRDELKQFVLMGSDLVKTVVDVERHIMAVGGEMHADEETLLLEDGSRQEHLWGINLFPDKPGDVSIEFDSMINLRPTQGNRSRGVDNPAIREKIKSVVSTLIKG